MNVTVGPFFEKAGDFLIDCSEPNEFNRTSILSVKCTVAHILGFWSAYLLPIICSFSFACNIFFIIVYFQNLKSMSRHMVYVVCVSMASLLSNITYAWFYLFVSRGLPYATNNRVYYFSYQKSRLHCKIHGLINSFSSVLVSNILLSASVDRYLTIYYPVKFSSIGHKHVWYVCFSVICVSAFMTLPFAFYWDWQTYIILKLCALPMNNIILRAYQTLFYYFGLAQTLFNISFNCAFVYRIKKNLHRSNFHTLNDCDRKCLTGSRILLILSVSYAMTALPEAILYSVIFISVAIFRSRMLIKNIVTLVNLTEIGWNIYFLREIADFIIYFCYLKPFHEAVISIFRTVLHTTYIQKWSKLINGKRKKQNNNNNSKK